MKIFRKKTAWKAFNYNTLVILMIMKLTVCMFLISSQSAMANLSYAEMTKLTLDFKDTPLSEVLAEIEDQSEFFFLYSKKVVNVDRKVDITVSEETVSKILDQLLEKGKETYSIIGRQIVLSVKNEPTASSAAENEIQQRTVNGTVTDEGGQPLPGVSVIVKGTTQGTVTNTDGNFTITGVPEGATLVFSFVGMRLQEMIVGNQTSINVTMQEESIGIDEVVAIGYGTASKATITGSVGKVEGDKLEIAQTANLSNTLVGRLPGLVTVTSRGVPGSDDPTIRIRGNNTLNNNSPLIVVDGVPGRGMSRLSAQDIESITVLKDASAAIYGSRAANGVILITTKRGKIDRLKTEATFTQGFASPTVLPEQAPSWLYTTMMNEWYVANGQDPIYSEEDIQKYKDGSSPYTHPNTDWMNEVFKPVSMETSGNVSFTGGTESLKYFASIGGRYQDAI
ncbi:MAG: SusC/RagA family TonB-linked outer membrane protein, partial [Prolixibacteraceae bacterium]|nr:SusC/RagA family TonB-linked outer membrane protein [Prolixibacteraceae bacterium]